MSRRRGGACKKKKCLRESRRQRTGSEANKASVSESAEVVLTRPRSNSVDNCSTSELGVRLDATNLSDNISATSVSDNASTRTASVPSSCSARKRRSTTTGSESLSPVAKRHAKLNKKDKEESEVAETLRYSRPRPPAIIEEGENLDWDNENVFESSDVVEDSPSSDEDDLANEHFKYLYLQYIGQIGASRKTVMEQDEIAQKRLRRFVPKHLQCELNNVGNCSVPLPPRVNETSCAGIGSPQEVWSLMVRRDELVKPNHRILDGCSSGLDHRTRAVLVDWMMEVCQNEKLHRESFHLAVDYVDRYLAEDKSVAVEHFQALGTTALFVAAKYEEIYPPKIDVFVDYTDGACTEEQVRDFELVMLKSLNWTLCSMTSIHWLAVYMQVLGRKEMIHEQCGEKHVSSEKLVVPAYLREDYMHMAKVLDLLLLDVGTLRFTYRQIAAAVLFTCYEPHKLVQEATGFTYEAIQRVIDYVDPCVALAEKRRVPNEALPHFEDVRIDELHSIQTHSVGNAEETFGEIMRLREEKARRLKELKKMRRRPPPLALRNANKLQS